MNKLKKAVAVLLALTLMLTIAGCSVSESKWAYKTDETTINAGVYRIFQIDAYTQAKNSVPSSVDSVLNEDIDGVKAEQWITDTVDKQIRIALAAEVELKAMGKIPLPEEDINGIKSAAQAAWDPQTASGSASITAKSVYGPYGVSYDSFEQYLYYVNLISLLLEARYGEGGSQETTDQELAQYLLNSYYAANLCMVTIDATDPASSTLSGIYENYVSEYNAGTLKWEDIRETEQFRSNADGSTPVMEGWKFPKADADSLPEGVKNALEKSEPGKAFNVNVDNMLYFFAPLTMEQAAVGMEKDQDRATLLQAYRGDALSNELLARGQNDLGIQVNNSVVKGYGLKNLEKDMKKVSSSQAAANSSSAASSSQADSGSSAADSSSR